jgi:UDP-N-acetylmuramoyl-tripeptide--D-alanyl-D-alanine ligase
MIELSLGEVAGIVGGELLNGDPSRLVTAAVEFDSRAITPGGLFLAFAGERADGHDFAAAAFANGAVAVLGTRAVDGPSVVVADPLAALAALATEVVRRLPDLTIVGVTGSAGKTSTKDLLAALLAPLGPTVAPPESFNNELGHPYTVLKATTQTRFLVLEKSARGLGHIAYLTRIAPPRIGVVLNVGSAHIGEFGSREVTAQAKGELVEALPSADDGGVAVLNADDPAVAAMSTRTSARVVAVGETATADLRAQDVRLDPLGRARFTAVAGDEQVEVALAVSGEHQVGNALAAIAAARECGLSLAAAAEILGRTTAASHWRMEITERPDGVVIVNDAYNANPESMRAALKTVTAMAVRGRTWALLGPMGELGDRSVSEHDTLGRYAVRLNVDTLVAIGEAARPIAQGAALEGSYNGESQWVPDLDAAVALVAPQLRSGDVVLVKASRAAGLERLAQRLAGSHPDEPGPAPAAGVEGSGAMEADPNADVTSSGDGAAT